MAHSPQSRQIQLVISDLDGTLVDTRAANHAAYQQAFADIGTPVTLSQLTAGHGLRFPELVEQLAPQLSSADRDRVRALKQQHYPAHFDLLRVNQPLVQWLRLLQQQGVRLALASTASRVNGLAVLQSCRLADLFGYVVFGEDVTHGKPDPECFQRCMDWAGVTSVQTLIIEDTDVGQAAAEASGASVIRLTDQSV